MPFDKPCDATAVTVLAPPPAPRDARADFAAVSMMSVAYAIALFHRTAYQAVAPALQSDFALSAAESADLAAVFFWTYLAVMIPLGVATDTLGARRVAIAGLAASALGAYGFQAADTVTELVAARMLLAAGSAAAFIALMRFIAIAYADRKATCSGRGILVGNVGAVASGAPLALLLVHLGWREVWAGVAAATALLALLLLAQTTRLRERGLRPVAPRDPIAELALLFRSPLIALGVVLQAGLAGAFYAFGNVVAPAWLAARGFAAIDSGWEISALLAGYGLGAAFWGWLGDRHHRRARALLAAACGAAGCWVALAVLPVRSLAGVASLFFLIGACAGAFVLVYALIAERHPPSHAGGVIACVNSGIPLGAAVLASAAGRLPPAAAPWLLALAAAVACGGTLLLMRSGSRRFGRSPNFSPANAA